MKKLLVILFTCLLLAGCSSKNNAALVNNGDDAIWEYKDTKYTKQDLNTDMKKNDFSSFVLQDYLYYIAEKEGFDLDKYAKDIDEEIAKMTEEGSLDFITYYYGSTDNYKNTAIYYSVISDLASKIAEEKLDSYISEYKPYKAQYAFFDTKEAAEKLIKDVKAGGDFETLAAEAGYSMDASAKILTDKDEDLIIEIKDYVNNTSTLGISDVITTSTTTTDADGNSVQTPRYYVLNLIEKDTSKLKEDIVAKLASEITEEDIISKFIEKYPIETHDQATYDLLSSLYEGIK